MNLIMRKSYILWLKTNHSFPLTIFLFIPICYFFTFLTEYHPESFTPKWAPLGLAASVPILLYYIIKFIYWWLKYPQQLQLNLTTGEISGLTVPFNLKNSSKLCIRTLSYKEPCWYRLVFTNNRHAPFITPEGFIADKPYTDILATLKTLYPKVEIEHDPWLFIQPQREEDKQFNIKS